MNPSLPDNLPAVLTVEETAKLLRIGRQAAYQAVRNGTIASVRIGRRRLVPKAVLDRLLAVAPTTRDAGEVVRLRLTGTDGDGRRG